MVLVRDGRAEERHDPVAHHLVHGSLVAVDRLHHAFEHRVEELARLLGVAVGKQLHRALEIGKQHGDLLALPFERAPRGQDLLGEVLGGVGLGGGEANRFSGEGGSARPTEFLPGTHRLATARAGERKARSAVFAEARPVDILGLAPQALHTAPSQRIRPSGQVRWVDGSARRDRNQGRTPRHAKRLASAERGNVGARRAGPPIFTFFKTSCIRGRRSHKDGPHLVALDREVEHKISHRRQKARCM
jgi:hypothetical protein